MVKKVKVGFRLRGKEIVVEATEMAGLNKALGLMVYDEVIFFRFPRGMRNIHSFFCKPFVAIWLCEGKVVEVRKINPWETSVSPSREFDTLIEIPINARNQGLVNFLLG